MAMKEHDEGLAQSVSSGELIAPVAPPAGAKV